jgi:hypothetical protein
VIAACRTDRSRCATIARRLVLAHVEGALSLCVGALFMPFELTVTMAGSA